MAIYIALAVFPVFLGIFFKNLNNDKRQKRVYYLICGLVMLAIMGLRHYSLGSTDTLNYYNAMKNAISSPTWSSYYNPDYFEVGSQLFIFSLSRIFNEPQWLLIASALVCILSIFYFVEHNCEDIPFSITIYITLGLWMFHMQGLRQSLAMCICLFAYEQAKNKKLFAFLALVCIAITMHQTAIVFLPVYFVCRMKFSIKNLCLMLFASVVAIFAADRIVIIANTIFGKEYTNTVDTGGYVALFIYLFIFVAVLISYKKEKPDKSQTSLFYILMIGMCCYMLRYMGAREAERISFYFMFSQLALLPRTNHLIVEKQRPFFRWIMVFAAILLFAYRLKDTNFIEYEFFWQ